MEVDGRDFLVKIVVDNKGEEVVCDSWSGVVFPGDTSSKPVVFVSSRRSGNFLISCQVRNESGSVVNDDSTKSRAVVSSFFGINVNGNLFNVDVSSEVVRDSLVKDLVARLKLLEFLFNKFFVFNVVQLDFGDLVGIDVRHNQDGSVELVSRG